MDSSTATVPWTRGVRLPGSFQCVITQTLGADQHTDTATASAQFTDAGGHVRTDTDTDDANAIGKTRVKITKTVDGKPFSGPSLTFEIRTGALPVTGAFGTLVEQQVASVANGGVVVFNSLLLPGTYQL